MGRNKQKVFKGLFAVHARNLAVAALFFVIAVIAATTPANPTHAINQQINYQGRLLNATGAIVPDGTYNMEFKIYQDGTGCVSSGSSPCGGTLKWTETRTGSNKVTLRNGYFSVQLGEITAFGTSVDWDQAALWLSVNVGGTGTPSWDGEMLPFRRMAASPYAMNAAKVGGLDISKLVQLGPSAVQVDSGTLSSVNINKTGATGNILQLQKNGNDVLTVANGGTLKVTTTDGTASALDLQAASSQTGDIMRIYDGSITPNKMLGVSAIGALTLQNNTNSTSAVTVQTTVSSGAHTVFNVDTANERVGIGGVASFSKFEVIGGDAAVYNSGANPRLVLGDSTAAGENGYLQWDSASNYFRIESVGTNGLKIRDNYVAIGNIYPDQPLKVGNGSTLLAQITTTGAASFQNSSDSDNAFKIEKVDGTDMLTVDTTNGWVVVGRVTSGASTNAAAKLLVGDDCAAGATGWCVFMGEYGTGDTDRMQLHGAMGIQFTTGYTPTDAVQINANGLLVLKNAAADPTGVAGGMYYNTATSKFRCFEGAAWANCIGSGGGGTPGGSNTQIQFNDGGAFGGDADLVWDKTGNDLSLNGADTGITLTGITNEPSSPSSGKLHIYSKSIAGRLVLKMKGPSGLDTPLQPALYGNNIAMLLPQNSTAVTAWGMANSVTGTVSTPALASTNLKSSMRRIQVASATTGNSAANLRSPGTLVWRGNATGLGGFFYQIRFSVNSTTTNQNLFAGLHSGTGALAGTQVPSALLNMIGVGWDAADTSLQVMSNDASGTATKTALGASFPVNNTTAVYELTLFAQPNGSNVAYRVIRLDTGSSAEGTISADLPSNTTFLTHHAHMTNGGTAAAVNIEVMRVYIESDY